jgi:3-phosphoshikimate 1-carboxyvinyltransferase
MQLFVSGSEHPLSGELNIPVSKYHAHRALVLASLAPGRSVIHGLSQTRQVVWTIGALRALGTRIEIRGDDYIVDGGPYRLAPDVVDHGSNSAEGLLNMGSSGTTLYFLTGLASLADRPVTLSGMKYFRRRPIGALLESLSQMGIRLESDDDRPPIVVHPGRPTGGHVRIAGTLSQWLSGLLLVAPFASRETTIEVLGDLNEQPYVELTVRMMRHFGLRVDHSDDWRTYTIPPDQTAVATDYTIPPDVGSAAFGLAATAIHPSDVVFRGLRTTTQDETDHPEAEFLDLVAAIGLPLERDAATGFVRVRHDGVALRPLEIDCQPIPDLLPTLATLATFAEGTTRLRNIGHIRLKESDRVKAMLQLNRLGGRLVDAGDELTITGTDKLSGAPMSSFNDHRVLMSLAVAATRAEGESRLTYPRAYRVSYPTFLEAMNGIGLNMGITSSAGTARAGAGQAIAS